ncbi:CHASE3 domain-containing protein [Mycobacterium sp. CVI_P3]|uniref:histidine kinase n=1 Tax=Mycobacterium pinniadriaticum TaxID=2994102 RepID=A0ABT3SHA0_9MYCO|nr:sensor histidine kinase [Mycobacterium pinniadriaticum]MCX2932315.1 CHASE3 domain-containing protein [Mycobacterium pinniadriaticum]MCX2938828.1 CHASE3 domain-containing protein [Mycobacterium pinniadriaticum]
MKEVEGTRLSGMTVRGWLNLVLLVVGVVVLGGALVAAVLLNRTDETSRQLIDHIQPARVAAYQLQAALRDQETAVRGYVLAADSQFLAPYYDGQRSEQAAAQDIRQLLGKRPELIGDLDAIEQASAAWRSQYAGPLIATVIPGVPSVVTRASAEAGKAQFDSLRVLFDQQNQDLATARSKAVEQLQTAQAWRDRALGVVIAAFVITGLAIAILVRNAVTRPLEALAAACRRITNGSFAEHIDPQGPEDIRSIAADVEAMRQRIVDELDATREARVLLDEQAAELRRSNAELEQFAYVASHDLQEPLRKVASFCQLLEKRYGNQLDERGQQYIDFAVDGAKRMQVLINDLLTFSRVGRLGATQVEVNLDTVLDAAVANVSTAIEEAGAQITRSGELPTVMGDPTLLTMLWQNLVSNAVKFRRDDLPPRIAITCEPGSGEEQGQWIFTFSDNGIGIADEFVDKVFVIFQRLHGRDAYAGTGIGLALVKKIIEHHGGTIRIDTTYDDGTRFEFTLPVMTASEHEQQLEGTAS